MRHLSASARTGLLALTLLGSPITAAAQIAQDAPPPTILVASGKVNRVYLPPPESIRPGIARRTASIVVNYNPGSCPAGVTTPWSSQAQSAFQYAADTWAAILNSSITIEIDACWRNDMAANTLGSTSATNFYSNVPNAPLSTTIYPVALANEIAGSDINGGTSEISISFNSTFNWYLGTDGNTPVDAYDFVSVVLHEIGHGLGFTGSMKYDNGTGDSECNGTAGTGCFASGGRIYDLFTETNAGTALTSLTTPSLTLGTQLTSNALFFDGTSANILNGSARVPIYAPATWNPGSSYSHLDESFNGTANALMTFSADLGEALHFPGTVTEGILIDMGWDIRNLNTIWVDNSFVGTETGSLSNPFNTIQEGAFAVYPGGTMNVRTGSYNEQLIITKTVIMRADGGVVVVGK